MGAVRAVECECARSRVSLALDGELSEIEEASLRRHIGRCAACAGFERDVDALTRELRAAPHQRPSAGVMLPRRRSAAVRALQISAAAAAVALAAGLGSLAGSLSSSGNATATTSATGGGAHGAALDRRRLGDDPGGGIVAMAPGQKRPAARMQPFAAL